MYVGSILAINTLCMLLVRIPLAFVIIQMHSLGMHSGFQCVHNHCYGRGNALCKELDSSLLKVSSYSSRAMCHYWDSRLIYWKMFIDVPLMTHPYYLLPSFNNIYNLYIYICTWQYQPSRPRWFLWAAQYCRLWAIHFWAPCPRQTSEYAGVSTHYLWCQKQPQLLQCYSNQPSWSIRHKRNRGVGEGGWRSQLHFIPMSPW